MKNLVLLVLAIFIAMVGFAGLGAADEKAKLGGESEFSIDKAVPADGWFYIQSGTVALIKAPNGVTKRVKGVTEVTDFSDDEPYQCTVWYTSGGSATLSF